MTNYENEPYVTISLRHQPASPDAGNPEDAVAWEVICRYCGDDPALDHQEVPAELRRIRGPYPIKAGIATFLEHDELHGRTDTRIGRECGMRTLVRSNWLQARAGIPTVMAWTAFPLLPEVSYPSASRRCDDDLQAQRPGRRAESRPRPGQDPVPCVSGRRAGGWFAKSPTPAQLVAPAPGTSAPACDRSRATACGWSPGSATWSSCERDSSGRASASATT